MKLKTKILLGYLVILALLLILGAYSLYNLNKLDRAAQNILKDNLHSVQLGKEMTTALDNLLVSQQQLYFSKVSIPEIAENTRLNLQRFETNLAKEQRNITEPGERETVALIAQNFAQLKHLISSKTEKNPEFYFTALLPKYELLRQEIDQVTSLNTDALLHKNQRAQETADRVLKYTIFLLSFSLLFTLMFTFSIPEAITSPIRKLTQSLEYVSQRNFSQTLQVESRDEFGNLANVFNKMLVRLREYEKSTLADLITEKNRIDSIITNLDEAIILLDAELKIILANPVACRLLAMPKEKLVNQLAKDIAAQNDLFQELMKGIQEAQVQINEPIITITDQGEEAFYRRDIFHVLAYNDVLEKQEFAGYIISLRNVSDFKKLDQVKSNFLATVSHELKTPLASINYSLKLLQDQRIGGMNTEQQQIVSTIKQENQRLQRMVSELLDISRIESGNIQLNTERANVTEIVRFASEPIQLQLKEKNIKLQISIPDNLPAVKADVEKTAWVLLNLISNGIRYSAENETIGISAQTNEAEVIVSVKDNGPGIEPQNHEKIFHKFVQIPGKAEYKGGAGLGLSISREFIQSQGGRIWVESEIGKGSRFSFTLPVIR